MTEALRPSGATVRARRPDPVRASGSSTNGAWTTGRDGGTGRGGRSVPLAARMAHRLAVITDLERPVGRRECLLQSWPPRNFADNAPRRHFLGSIAMASLVCAYLKGLNPGRGS